jgi:hypothetical protein
MDLRTRLVVIGNTILILLGSIVALFVVMGVLGALGQLVSGTS